MPFKFHVLTIAASLFILATATRLRPPQIQLNPPDQSLQSTFGVGFDLTASYGSAAVSFFNGTIITVATIPADDEFNQVLQRLSLDSSKHPSPPYNDLGESWDDMPRQYMRKARKAIGQPASSDVGHLAKMLSHLRDAVEKRVGPITTAGVTSMHLVALYDEDLHDAFEYVGLEYITFPVGYVGRNILYETSAAYAGYGYGLCSNYKAGPEACIDEIRNMTDRAVMAVVYTDTALSVSLSMIKSAYALYEPPYRYLADFDLGHQAGLETSPKQYWDAVTSKLQEILVENPNYERPSLVMLMGDRIRDPMFQEVLNKALDEEVEEMPEILSEEAPEVAAKGAAEMAKRALIMRPGAEADGLPC